jgi:hypothetical protein
MEDDLILPAEPELDKFRPNWLQQGSPVSDSLICQDLESLGVEKPIAGIIHDIRIISKRVTTHLAYNSVEESLSLLIYVCSSLHTALTYECKATAGSSTAIITNLCRYAVALHLLTPWKGLKPNSSFAVNIIAHKMKTSLAQIVIQTPSDDLLLWLLFTGGVAVIGMPEREWFVGHLVKAIDDRGIKQWDKMQKCLEKLIWHQRLNAETHEMLWNEAKGKKNEFDIYWL